MTGPFHYLNDCWYVDIDWRPEQDSTHSLQQLQLKRLSASETDQLTDSLNEAAIEAWAQLFPTDEALTCLGSEVKVTR